MDIAGNMTSIRYHIHVLNEHEKIRETKIEKKTNVKVKESKKLIKQSKGIVTTKKTMKAKKITFFDPPNIELQNSKFVEANNRYTCYTNSKSCSLNLNL